MSIIIIPVLRFIRLKTFDGPQKYLTAQKKARAGLVSQVEQKRALMLPLIRCVLVQPEDRACHPKNSILGMA
jgi:hypothetical protein